MPADKQQPDRTDAHDDFARQAAGAQRGLFGELVDFLKHDRRWWLTPIIVLLILVGVLLVLGGTSMAPFLYTLF